MVTTVACIGAAAHRDHASIARWILALGLLSKLAFSNPSELDS